MMKMDIAVIEITLNTIFLERGSTEILSCIEMEIYCNKFDT